MRCGPAPVQAVKLGHVFLGYDTKFIFAEVNGDKLFWLVENDDIVPCELDRCEHGVLCALDKGPAHQVLRGSCPNH